MKLKLFIDIHRSYFTLYFSSKVQTGFKTSYQCLHVYQQQYNSIDIVNDVPFELLYGKRAPILHRAIRVDAYSQFLLAEY